MDFIFNRTNRLREDQIGLSAASNDFELSSDGSNSDYREIVEEETFEPEALVNSLAQTQSVAKGSLSERRNRSFLTCDTNFHQSEYNNAGDADEDNDCEEDDVYPISSLSRSASPSPDNINEKYVIPEQAGDECLPSPKMNAPVLLSHIIVDNDVNQDLKSLPFFSWKLRQLQASPITRVSKLLQNQRARFGMDMLQAIIDDNDRAEIEFLIENLGYSFEEAALYRFNAQRGLKLPEPGRLSAYPGVRPLIMQCVRLSPQNNDSLANEGNVSHSESRSASRCGSRLQSRGVSRAGSRTASPTGSVFSFNSCFQYDENQVWSLADIEEAVEYFHEAHNEFMKGLTESHATSLTILLSKQEQIHGFNMFDSLDGFQYCYVRDSYSRGFPLDKAVWRMHLTRFPEDIDDPAAFFLRDLSDNSLTQSSPKGHMRHTYRNQFDHAQQPRSRAHSADVYTTGASQSSLSSLECRSPSCSDASNQFFNSSWNFDSKALNQGPHLREPHSSSSSLTNIDTCARMENLTLGSNMMIAQPEMLVPDNGSPLAVSTGTMSLPMRHMRLHNNMAPLPLSPRSSPHSPQSRRHFFPNSAGEVYNCYSPTNYLQMRNSPKSGTVFPSSFNAISPTYLSSNQS